jgi:phosphinothricin acetyltransferase
MPPSVNAMLIRPAAPDDLRAIDDIYNHYVVHSTCTWQRDIEPLEARGAWFAAHGPAHPVTVVEQDGEVVGWGALSTFRARWGYRHTVENSVYVRHDRHGRGLGSALLADLIDRAAVLGHHTIIAGISADQERSIALHRRFGFVEVARMREVGHKHDRWIDLVFLQRML